MKVLGIGNALVDIIIRLKDENLLAQYGLPKGSMQLVDKLLATEIEQAATGLETTLASGGSAANTIHGLAKLGVESGYLGKIGKDEHGLFFRGDMEGAGVLSLLPFGKEETGRAITLVTPDSERTFATYLGSAIEVNTGDLDEKFIQHYQLLHLEGYLAPNHALTEQALKMAKRNGLLTSLDLASFNVVEANRDFLQEMVADYIDIVFANEEEAKAFTGHNANEAVTELARLCDIAVVKTGQSGSLVQQGNKLYRIGIVKANCIDTTGAGDLYAAGFLYGICKGKTLDVCGNWGALLAGRVIEGLGAKIAEQAWHGIISTIEGQR